MRAKEIIEPQSIMRRLEPNPVKMCRLYDPSNGYCKLGISSELFGHMSMETSDQETTPYTIKCPQGGLVYLTPIGYECKKKRAPEESLVISNDGFNKAVKDIWCPK